jgi:prepilin-type N-terminal cleavage/methylation domain-containing protein
MSSDKSRPARGAERARSQRGMTLIELLAAMSISLVISAMIIMSWVALSGSYANTVRRGKATDFARFAMDRMQREIRDAEQPPDGVAETAILRARPYYVVLYTTFNKTDSAAPSTPPRQVMYRLYSVGGVGELWRFQDRDGDGTIENVTLSIGAPLTAREAGEGAQMLAKNIVNLTSPSTTNPTPLFTYIYYGADGALVTDDHEVIGVDERAQIRAVEINLLIDMNPGKSPVYWHVRSTAQLRNTR